jgi:hypothetical protein
VVDGGTLGIIGRSGWYIPSYLAPEYPQYLLDFWRAYQNPEARALFPPSGSTPDALMQGDGRQFIPEWCVAAMTNNCTSTSIDYVNRKCDVAAYYNNTCMELYAITDTYDSGLLQQQVRNNALNITIPFLSETNYYNFIQNK